MILSSILKQVKKPAKYHLIENNPYTFSQDLEDINILNFGSYETSINQINFQILYSILANSKVFRPQRFFIPDDDFLALTKDLNFDIRSIDEKKILDKSKFIDTELLIILTEIQTHNYHQNMLAFDKSLIMTATYRHENLEVFKESLESYFELFIRLEKYSERNLKKHVNRSSLKK